MSGGLSIRARLTLTIMAVTLVVGSLAVIAGLAAFESQVRNQSIEATVAELDPLYFPEFDELFIVDDSPPTTYLETDGQLIDADDEAALFDERFAAEPLATMAWRTVIELDELGQTDLIYSHFGDVHGVLHVLLFDGTVAAIPQSLGRYEVISLDETDAILVPQFDLEELAVVSSQRFEHEPDDVPREVEPVVVEVDQGLTLGLLVDLTDEMAALDAIAGSLWLAAGILTLLAGAATWMLTARALRPVAAITNRVDEISSGTLDGRVPETGTGDEIGVLAQTMNQMLGRLERSDLQRRQFVSDASHELRTPVAVLRSEAEVAQRAPETTSVENLATVVLGEAGRLEGLVEDLLTLARSDEAHRAGGRPVGPDWSSEVDVDDVVLTEAGRARRLPVDRSQVSAGRVRGRADDLARTVGHLLDNAARHGESKVTVGVRTVEGWVQVWVEDDGAGVPDEDQARIFERFTRLDEARSRDRGGSGLGLAVVAETVAGLGGTVTVGSSPLGGALFAIRLPAA